MKIIEVSHVIRDVCGRAADLAALPLERLAHVPAAVVDATGFRGRALGPELFAAIVRHWGTEQYFTLNPFRTAEASAYLVGAGVPVCEHMTNLAQVSASAGFLHAGPIAWRGGASFPVRVYVILPGP